jgi:uncharacterized protein DUF3601
VRYAAAMYGPCPAGHFTVHGGTDDFQMLRAGRAYRVTQPFTDYDGDLHPAGEGWTFLGHNFVPYHDGLSLFVSLDGAQEWQIRMSWRPEDQGPIIDAIGDYLAPG